MWLFGDIDDMVVPEFRNVVRTMWRSYNAIILYISGYTYMWLYLWFFSDTDDVFCACIEEDEESDDDSSNSTAPAGLARCEQPVNSPFPLPAGSIIVVNAIDTICK